MKRSEGMRSCVIIASHAAAIAEIVERSIKDVCSQIDIEKAFDEVELNRVIDTREPGLVFLESNFCEIATAYVMAQKLSDNGKLRFVIFSFERVSAQDMGRFYNLGAVGFLNYRTGTEKVLYGIAELLDGKEYISKKAKKTLKDFRIGRVEQPAFTVREVQVLKYTALGKSLGEIAEILSITLKSVQNIKTKMYQKAGIKNNVQIMLFALSMGYVTLNELVARNNEQLAMSN
jgi:DNA-binding NarL/FixJ family response regulator